MSGDRLAEIEELRRSGQLGAITVSDVLALVEIAKAARALMEDVDEIMDEDLRLDALKQKIGAAFLGYGGAWNHEDEFRAALARLDSGAAEEDA